MYKLIFSILTLLLIIVLLKDQKILERFDTNINNQCQFVVDRNEHYFQNIYDCVEKCKENENCNNSDVYCQQTCLECKGKGFTNKDKNELCPWYVNYNPESSYLKNIELRGFEGNGNCLLEWKAPRPDIVSYYLKIDEEMDSSSSIDVKVLEPGCTNCNYVLDYLKNGTSYIISIKCLLKDGSILKSNEIKIIPNGEDSNSIDYLYKQLDGQNDRDDYPENCEENINDENHSLDKVTHDNIDLFKFIDRLL